MISVPFPYPKSLPLSRAMAEKDKKKDDGGSKANANAVGKSSSGSGADQLNLKVIGQDGQVIQFKIKPNTPFRKLIHAYCDRQKLVAANMRFVFDGERVQEADTPGALEMEDGDTIEVFSHQTGGGRGGRPILAVVRGRRRKA